MLGHANLDTTQIYTHVAIHTLKAVHAATHPGASLRPRQTADADTTTTTPPHPHLAILLDEDEADGEDTGCGDGMSGAGLFGFVSFGFFCSGLALDCDDVGGVGFM